MRNIAIIPARSGSKGLPNKNIRLLNGKPLMAYSIEAALQSSCFDEVMVSTDSEHYAEIARQYGANIPFLRSEATSSDTASSWDMVEEVLANYQKLGKSFDTFCLLQPTSPLRTAEDIKAAYALYEEKASFAVVSVCETEHSPLWAGQLPENHEFINFIEPNTVKRRQDAGRFYRLNGAIYIANTEKFKTDKFFYHAESFAYVMPQERSVDIDTLLDFTIAEAILKKLAYENNKAIYKITDDDAEMIAEHKKFYAEFFYFGNKLLDECFPSPIQDYELTIYSAYYRILELLDTLEVMTENSLINSGFLIVRSLLECAAQLCYVLCDDNQIEKRAIIWQMMDIKHSTEDPDSNVKAAKETEFYRRMENTNCYKGFVDIIKNSRTWPNWYSYCEGKRTGITDVFTIAGLQDLHDTLYSALCRENHEVNHMETNIEIRLDDEKKFHFKPFRVFYENHVLLMDCIIRSLLPVNKMMIDRYGDAKLKSEWQAYEAKSIEYVGSNKKLAEEIDKYLNPNHKWF